MTHLHLYDAEIHVARSRILNLLGFADEADMELKMANKIADIVAWRYSMQCLDLTEVIMPSDEIAIEWDCSYLSGIWHREEEAQEDAQIAAFNALYPPSCEEHYLYCPRGHDSILSKAGWMECGCCGAPMTAISEDQYYDALCAAGQCM